MGLSQYIKIGDRIKGFRMRSGISQKDMAAMIGTPVSTYSNYENDNREPPIETLEAIAEQLGITVNLLIGIDSGVNGEGNGQGHPVFRSPSFVIMDWLAALGYKVETYEKDAYLWIRELSTGDCFEIEQSDLEGLEKSISDYTRYQVQNLFSRSMKLPSSNKEGGDHAEKDEP